jgi:ABC-2 type transport system permease protein
LPVSDLARRGAVGARRGELANLEWTAARARTAAARASLEQAGTLSQHFIEIGYGILLRGSGLQALWPSVVMMTVLGAALFGAGLWRFRRQFGA